MKFIIESYYNEIFLIGGKFLNIKLLDNFENNEKELTCEIKKEDLIEILPKDGGNLFLYYWDKYSKIQQYENVIITVNAKIYKKKIYMLELINYLIILYKKVILLLMKLMLQIYQI